MGVQSVSHKTLSVLVAIERRITVGIQVCPFGVCLLGVLSKPLPTNGSPNALLFCNHKCSASSKPDPFVSVL